ncbi:MAG TPA: tetratricopeptide repeat protein [Gemmataceae bacterium]|nr:tetratricopeptide repeat protein [Gemmataceae bacterium]
MLSHAIACPQCRAALRSSRPVPEHKRLRCPQCGATFTTPNNPASAATPPPLPLTLSSDPSMTEVSSGSRLWVPALFAGMFIVGGLAVAGVYLAQPRPPAPQPPPTLVEEPKPPREDEDKRQADEKQLAEQRRKLDEERRQLEEDKKLLDFARRMRKAEEALKEKNFAEAEKGYRDALKLYPDNADAKSGLLAAKTSALAAEAVTTHTKEERQKRETEIARLMEQGKAAMGQKEFAAAVRAFTIAKQLAPDDGAVGKALDDALAAADADAGEKKKLADYQRHMDAGRLAMTAQRFEDAVSEFQAALKILPGDRTAGLNLKTAQNRLAAGADLAKRQDAYADLMQRAQAALNAKRPDQAAPLLKEASKLFPDDKNTRKMLKAAMLDAATAQAEYNRLLALGDAAMTRQRFEEANRLYTQAGQTLPGDAEAAGRAQAAANAVTNRQAALVAYQRFMAQGTLNLENLRYPAAIRNFQEALRVVPGDANALQGLADARAAVVVLNRQRVLFDALLLKGTAALQQLQFGPAIAAYTEALQVVPNDPRALVGLTKARYGQAMVQGRVALAANRQQQAILAFELALQQAPGDPTAMALLTQARIRRK